jgi:hypothetical protein
MVGDITSDPNPRVSGESICRLAWRSFSGRFLDTRRLRTRVSPRVCGVPVVSGP